MAAEHALALNPSLADGHAALAKILYLHDWDWNAAQAQIQEALRLDPNSRTLAWAAYLSVALGQLDASIDFLQRHVANDPLDPHAFSYLGVVRYRAGKFAAARTALDIALDLNPAESGAHAAIGQILLASGDPTGALAEIEREKDTEHRIFAEALAFHALGRKSDSDLALASLKADFGLIDAYDVAAVHAYRGESDLAFLWLDRAYDQRNYATTWVASDPLLKNLQLDPRYAAFLRKMKLSA
jgi:Flp pilus assembly protein TadD